MAKAAVTETTDARILDMAAEHIRKYGLARTTVVAVAAEAGMSHANVYRYFPSKRALVDAVTDHWLRPLEAGLRVIADGPDPAFDKLERIAIAIQRGYRDKLEHDPNLFAIFAAGAETGSASARRHRSRVQGEVQRVLEEGLSVGHGAADLRRALALVYDALHRFIHPVSVRLDSATPRDQIEARFERVLRLMIRALRRTGGAMD